MTPQEAFVTRLRRHRQRCRVSLDDISTETRVKRELLEALENNDLSAWPRGLYARAWIRSYAMAVGIDPDGTVQEFCRLFPQGDRRANETLRELATIVASPSTYRDEYPHPENRRRSTPEDTAPAPPAAAPEARNLWLRIVSAAIPYLRPRRTPRTSM